MLIQKIALSLKIMLMHVLAKMISLFKIMLMHVLPLMFPLLKIVLMHVLTLLISLLKIMLMHILTLMISLLKIMVIHVLTLMVSLLFFQTQMPWKLSISMINKLWCKFQQCLGQFTMFLFEGSPENRLFRHLSNHVFRVRTFGNKKSIRIIFLFKIFKI